MCWMMYKVLIQYIPSGAHQSATSGEGKEWRLISDQLYFYPFFRVCTEFETMFFSNKLLCQYVANHCLLSIHEDETYL